MKNPLIPVLACVALAAPLSAQPAFEQPVVLSAAEFLPQDALRGPTYRVRDQVVTDGYMAHFEIDSDFGKFDAVGVPQALQRIREMDAIRKLVETSKGDLFAEGVKRSIEQPVDAVKNIVTHPVDSVKQAPKTVGHFFGNIGSAIGRGVDKVKESTSGGNEPSAGEVGSGIGKAARSAAGFDKAKLDTAKQLGVDPYSDNARLQEEMDKVTWAFFAGGMPLRVGAAVASAGVALAATNMVGLPEDTYALTEGEIARRDGNSLVAMGVREDDIKGFQLNPALSTSKRHLIVKGLEALPDTRGRGNVILLANACETRAEADFLIGSLALLVERQKSGAAAYQTLSLVGRLPVATTAQGGIEVAAPVDYVTWTEEVASFAGRKDLGTAPKTLVHTGRLSPAATAGLEAAGWKLAKSEYLKR